MFDGFMKESDEELMACLINLHFPAIRSGYRRFQRPLPGKQFPTI